MKNHLTLLAALLVAFSLNAQSSRFTKITVASWNIGHFALGKSGDTQLTHDALEFNRQAYCALFNDLGADILALVEEIVTTYHPAENQKDQRREKQLA